jgi:hypothetical protein
MVLAAEPICWYCRNNEQHLAHRRAVVLVKLETRFSHMCHNLWSFCQCLCSQSMSEARDSPDYTSLGTHLLRLLYLKHNYGQ